VAATENVTVLFTDMVGSTELALSVSVEASDELRRAHFTLLRRAVTTSGGSEVKSLGDGLMAVFPTASAALNCAVAMQQAVDRDNRRSDRPVGLRVGVSAGETTVENGDFFGDPVIEAARLCAQAIGGQILVADLVRATAGRRAPYEFSPVGPLQLKGLPEPLDTLAVGWEPLGDVASRVPLPPRLEVGPSIGVIGRASESASLEDAFERAVAGDGRRVVLVAGEGGMGKTTLAAQLASAAYERGAGVLLGRCDEDLGAPYGPFVEALSHYVKHAAVEDLEGHIRSHGGELSRIVPSLARRLGDVPSPQSADPDTERYLMYGAVVALLTDLAANQPLVLVLDDLQWADKTSLQMLRHVVANTVPARILILATYRDSDLGAAHPLSELLAALRRESGVTRVDLAGLDQRGVLALIEASAGYALGTGGEELAESLFRETDGNPFFVGEVLRHLVDTGAIVPDDGGRWTAAGGLEALDLPNSVREVITARVARLGEQAAPVLSVACVIGRDFDVELLGLVSELGEDDLLDVLDAAAGAALIREVSEQPGHYTFAHALIQRTLYQELGLTRRARLHRVVAEGIEELCGEETDARVGELAHHWLCATQRVSAKAVFYARRAAEAALAALAPEDALRYFTQALQLAELTPGSDPLLVCDLRLGLGEAQRQAGIAAFRESFLTAAHEAEVLGASDLLVRAALSNNRGFVSSVGAVDVDRVAVLESALAALPTDDSADRALVLATLCSELTYGSSPDRCAALAREAKAMAARVGDATTAVRVLILALNAVLLPSSLAERTADTRKALALAQALGDPDLLYGLALHGRINAMQGGDFATAHAHLDTMRRLSDQLRLPALMWHTAFSLTTEALRVGEVDQAEKLAAVSLELGTESSQPDAYVFYAGQVAMVYGQQGRLGELVSFFEDLVAQNPGLGNLKQGLALAYLEVGRGADALALLESGAADGFASLPMDLVWIFGATAYADVAIQLEAAGPAAQLYALLEPYHYQVPFIASGCSLPVATYLGGLGTVLGRYDEAEVRFAEAADLNERGDMKYAAARTDVLWARMLRRRGRPGDIERARALLEHARSAAEAYGYALVARHASEGLSTLA